MGFSVSVNYVTYNGDSSLEHNYIIKPGKKWYVPLDAVNEIQTNSNLKITPMTEEGEEMYEKQPLNWKSDSTNELISFDDKINIQVEISLYVL